MSLGRQSGVSCRGLPTVENLLSNLRPHETALRVRNHLPPNQQYELILYDLGRYPGTESR